MTGTPIRNQISLPKHLLYAVGEWVLLGAAGLGIAALSLSPGTVMVGIGFLCGCYAIGFMTRAKNPHAGLLMQRRLSALFTKSGGKRNVWQDNGSQYIG